MEERSNATSMVGFCRNLDGYAQVFPSTGSWDIPYLITQSTSIDPVEALLIAESPSGRGPAPSHIGDSMKNGRKALLVSTKLAEAQGYQATFHEAVERARAAGAVDEAFSDRIEAQFQELEKQIRATSE